MVEEVAAMRKSLFYLALFLVGCGGDGGGFAPPTAARVAGQDVPEISNLTLSPDTVMVMEGNGSVVVTAQVDFRDAGLDIQTLWVEIFGGTRLSFPVTQSTESGTLTEQFAMSTETVGAFNIDVWVMDTAGNSSNHLGKEFDVVGIADTDEWTSRLTGLPFVLNDVLWDGGRFIVVGDRGVILTSDNGIDWVERESFTDVDLNAVASHGSDIVAVGFDTTVLLSTDSGESWSIKHSGNRVRLAAVAVNSSQFVAGGMDLETGDAFIMRSLDRGDTWTVVDSLPQSGHFVTDLVYVNGLFVAATDVFSSASDARVLVSLDGNVWHDIIIRDEAAASYAILHDGNRFIVAGSDSTVFVSTDGYNWTESQTPVQQVTYLSAAWNGSKLVVAGGITWWYWWFGPPTFERPVAISSIDGGATWAIVDIDGYYESRGMAWGNGRFVSVGQSTPISGEGAIYTSD